MLSYPVKMLLHIDEDLLRHVLGDTVIIKLIINTPFVPESLQESLWEDLLGEDLVDSLFYHVSVLLSENQCFFCSLQSL